ncbi:MAG: hypothetical protein JHC95_11375 [Solirubrobacteraceae bacterium]|nr:hypothetical protein [Solirubrobacteraceae bacterium]
MTVPAPPAGLVAQLAIALGAFAAGTLVALLFGAVNLGVAMGVGQIVFAIAAVWILLRG